MRSILLLVLLGVALATRVNFDNKCTRVVQVIANETSEETAVPVQIALLNSGQRAGFDYWNDSMSFKDGWTGRTLVQFSFASWNGMDDYYLSVAKGFDTPMQIATDRDGPTVVCREPKCADALTDTADDTKKHWVPTGGTFTITFCP